MGEVVDFPGGTTAEVPVKNVLGMALEKDLSMVIVLGYKTEDGEEYFASSSGERARLLWLIERAKRALLSQ